MLRRFTLPLLSFLIFSFISGVAGSVELPLSAKGLRIGKAKTTFRQMKKRLVTFQEYDYSCGAAVISTILTYYFGEPVSEREVIAGLFKNGDVNRVLERKAFSLLDMKRFALARGYKALGYKMDFEFLVDLKQPVIVPVTIRGYDHFIVFKGLVGDRVFIADPAFGNYTVRVNRFLSMWRDGIGFVLKRQKPVGPPTKEDLHRQARFLGRRDVSNIVTTNLTPTSAPIPGQIQSITGPRATGGAFLPSSVVPPSPVSPLN